MPSYTVHIGPHASQAMVVSESDEGDIPSSYLLNQLAPSPPFSIPGVSASLLAIDRAAPTGSSGASSPNKPKAKRIITTFSQCEDEMELCCTFDAKVLMRGLIENTSDISIVRQSMWVLCVSEWSARDKIKASNLSIVEGISRILTKHSGDIIVSENALGALRIITSDSSENRSRLGSVGASTIFSLLRQFSDSERLISNGVWVLAQIAESKSDLSVADATLWTETLTPFLSTHIRHTDLIAAVCVTLGGIMRLAAAAELPVPLIQHTCMSIIQALKTHRAVPPVVSGACNCLSRLMKQNPVAHEQICLAGGIGLFLNILRDAKSCSGVETMASSAMSALAVLINSDSKSLEHAQRAGAEGAVDLTISTITNLLDSTEVVESGFKLLTALLLDQRNQVAAGAGAFELIITSLDIYRGNLNIVFHTCEALDLLMETEANQELVFFSDLMPVLVAALRTCVDPSSAPASPMSRQSSTSSVKRGDSAGLSSPIPEKRERLISEPAETLEELVAAAEFVRPPPPPSPYRNGTSLRPPADVLKTIVAACSALCSAMGSNCFERARGAGALDVIYQIVVKYMADENVAEQSCWTLYRLAFTTLGQIQLGNMGAVQLMFKVLEYHKRSQRVEECVVSAISNLTYDPNNALVAGSLSGVAVMTQMITMFAASDTIVERACVSLSNILAVLDDVSIVREYNTISVVMHVLADHADSPDVVEQALWALGNMICDDTTNKDVAISCGVKDVVKELSKKYSEVDDIMVQIRRIKSTVNKIWWMPFDFDWILS